MRKELTPGFIVEIQYDNCHSETDCQAEPYDPWLKTAG
jgi:hypothetical protein